MKAIRVDLPPELHEYLTTVITKYSRGGIDPEEGMILFHLWDFVAKRAQVVELEVRSTAQTPPLTTATTAPIQIPNPPADEDDLGDR